MSDTEHGKAHSVRFWDFLRHITAWIRNNVMHEDAMDRRLRTAPSADTPLTAQEQAKLDESRAQFNRGEYVVDAATSRDVADAHPVETVR